MDKILVINKLKTAQTIDVRHADGRLDHVRIMPKSRVHLREGLKVCARYAALNSDKLTVIEPTPQVDIPAHEAPFTPQLNSGDE